MNLRRFRIMLNILSLHTNLIKTFSSRSVFKPFVFAPNISQLSDTSSPTFEPEYSVKKKPHFNIKPDRRHPLYQKHQEALEILDSKEV